MGMTVRVVIIDDGRWCKLYFIESVLRFGNLSLVYSNENREESQIEQATTAAWCISIATRPLYGTVNH
jgi:hypothetical protein